MPRSFIWRIVRYVTVGVPLPSTHRRALVDPAWQLLEESVAHLEGLGRRVVGALHPAGLAVDLDLGVDHLGTVGLGGDRVDELPALGLSGRVEVVVDALLRLIDSTAVVGIRLGTHRIRLRADGLGTHRVRLRTHRVRFRAHRVGLRAHLVDRLGRVRVHRVGLGAHRVDRLGGVRVHRLGGVRVDRLGRVRVGGLGAALALETALDSAGHDQEAQELDDARATDSPDSNLLISCPFENARLPAMPSTILGMPVTSAMPRRTSSVPSPRPGERPL
jgi:hypothetical protein